MIRHFHRRYGYLVFPERAHGSLDEAEEKYLSTDLPPLCMQADALFVLWTVSVAAHAYVCACGRVLVGVCPSWDRYRRDPSARRERQGAAAEEGRCDGDGAAVAQPSENG